MKRITVEKCLEKFEVTDGDYAVFVVNDEGKWGIENGYGGKSLSLLDILGQEIQRLQRL